MASEDMASKLSGIVCSFFLTFVELGRHLNYKLLMYDKQMHKDSLKK